MKRKILLLGGGYCLSRLAEKLASDSFIVTSTSEEGVQDFKRSGYISRCVDLGDRRSLEGLFQEFDGFEAVIDSVPPYLIDDSYSAYLQDLTDMLSLAERHGVCRLGYLSTIGVFGRTDGSIVNEESAVEPLHARGKARVDAEKIYSQSALQSYIFRLAGIYGPGRGLAKRIQAGVYPSNLKREKWSNRIHVDDIVSVLSRFCNWPDSYDPSPGVYCISDDCPAPLGDVIDYYCKTFGIELKTRSEGMAVSEGRRARFALNQKVSNAKMKRELLPDLLYPSYRDGVETTVV